MQRTLVDSQRGFVHHFREGRVSVTDTRQIFGRAGKLHRHHCLSDQFGGVGTDDVHTEMRSVSLPMRDIRLPVRWFSKYAISSFCTWR